MVTCERCHRKFGSYSGLLEHYKAKHPNVTNLSELQNHAVAEAEISLHNQHRSKTHRSSHAKLVAFVVIIVVAVSVIGYVAVTPHTSQSSGQGVGALGAGKLAPDFTLPDTFGGTFTLSAYRGKSNVLLFFNEGLSCSPCLQQMHDLDQLNPEFLSLNVVVVSITGDSLTMLSSWANSNGPQYSKVLSDQSLTVSNLYGVLGPDVSMMPGSAPGHTFILVDKSGIIKWRQDYGPGTMYVPNDQIIAAVKQFVGT